MFSCKGSCRESSKEVLGRKAVHEEMLEHIILVYEGEAGVEFYVKHSICVICACKMITPSLTRLIHCS